MKASGKERVAVFSDGTGETAEAFVRAVLAQFERSSAGILRVPGIKSEAQLKRELEKLDPPYLVAYTFAAEKLRKVAWGFIRARSLVGIDLLYPAVEIFSEFLKANPTQTTGALHSTQAMNYFERVEAIEFTVKHDDGMRLNNIRNADLILTGVSRSSKTPTSIYLAHKGYRVANVPLVPGIDPPQEIFDAQKHGVPIVCLMINPLDLERIRRSRLNNLGSDQQDYTDLHRIKDELEAAQKLSRRHAWPILDVTNRAIEETASEILLLINSKER